MAARPFRGGQSGSGCLVQPFHLPALAARLGDPQWAGQGLAVPAGPGDGVGILRAHISLLALEVRPGSPSRGGSPRAAVSLSERDTGLRPVLGWGCCSSRSWAFVTLSLQKDGETVWALEQWHGPATGGGHAHIRGRWKARKLKGDMAKALRKVTVRVGLYGMSLGTWVFWDEGPGLPCGVGRGFCANCSQDGEVPGGVMGPGTTVLTSLLLCPSGHRAFSSARLATEWVGWGPGVPRAGGGDR